MKGEIAISRRENTKETGGFLRNGLIAPVSGIQLSLGRGLLWQRRKEEKTKEFGDRINNGERYRVIFW